MKWLPHGWLISVNGRKGDWVFGIGADGLPEERSQLVYNTKAGASKGARQRLRAWAYSTMDSGWSGRRLEYVHACIPGQSVSFCGCKIEDGPNIDNFESIQCGRCMAIIDAIEREQR
jgi:hypothetical protein